MNWNTEAASILSIDTLCKELKSNIAIASLDEASPNKILWSFGVLSSFMRAKVHTTSVADRVAPTNRASCIEIFTDFPLFTIRPISLQV